MERNAITGYLRQDVVGRFCVENLLANRDKHDSFAADSANAIAAVLRDGKPVAVHVSRCHKEGHRVLVRLRVVPIRNSHGSVIGAAESFEESLSVSSWDRRQGKLAAFGCIDETAGVCNREFLLFQVRESLDMFNKYRIPFSVLCVEVDQLDHFQAKHGIQAVVAVQRAIAQTLGNSLRPTDCLGRHNGATQPIAALSTMADSLPGLRIVAAVLGVVITMGALGGSPEEIGHKVAAALVGTFLGILLCYGLVGPVAANMGKAAEDEHAYYNVLRVLIVSIMKGNAPTTAVEIGRRAIPGHVRPDFQETEKFIKDKGAATAAAA
jgi:hypothetical protein